MNTPDVLNSPRSVMDLFRQVVTPFLPKSMQAEIERDWPLLSLYAHRIGVDILLIERQGIPFAEAVKRPEHLDLGRMYFGALNLLQWRLPPPVRRMLTTVIRHAIDGRFEPAQRVLFALASRRDEPEAALCRFLLWMAIQLNLLILSWDEPEVEARHSLAAMERMSEKILRRILAEAESAPAAQDDLRPLHLLIAEMMIRLYAHDNAMAEAMDNCHAIMQELALDAGALEKLRRLDARSAAVLRPGGGDIGSQQTADRYPHLFTSANTMEQHRSRVLKRRRRLQEPNDRFIDLLRAATGHST